jgi:putative membrane protein
MTGMGSPQENVLEILGHFARACSGAAAHVSLPESGGTGSMLTVLRSEGHVMRFLLVWILNALALLIVAYLYPGVQVRDWVAAAVAALVLGLVNALVKPILVVLTFPVTVVTLGLFLLVINALLFWGVAEVVPGFGVSGFWAAMLGAVLYSIIAWALAAILPGKQ